MSIQVWVLNHPNLYRHVNTMVVVLGLLVVQIREGFKRTQKTHTPAPTHTIPIDCTSDGRIFYIRGVKNSKITMFSSVWYQPIGREKILLVLDKSVIVFRNT